MTVYHFFVVALYFHFLSIYGIFGSLNTLIFWQKMVFTFSSVWCGRKFWSTKNLWPGLQKTMGFGRKMFCTLKSGVHSLQFLALNFLFYSKNTLLNFFFLSFFEYFCWGAIEHNISCSYFPSFPILMLNPNCLPTWVGSLLKFVDFF